MPEDNLLLRYAWSLVRLNASSCQRVIGALVELAYALVVESLFIDFEKRSYEEGGRKLLNRKADGIRSSRKSSIAKGMPLGFPASCGKQLGLRAVVKCGHGDDSHVYSGAPRK
jgi:hypothetical protein